MVLDTLPKTITLRDGKKLQMSLLEVADCLSLVEFYRRLPEQDRQVLKDDVTTPAGCTIAGILALEDGRIRSVLARGVETAAKVAAELGK